MKKWLTIVLCTAFAVSGLMLASCQKKEAPAPAVEETKPAETGSYGGEEKAPAAGEATAPAESGEKAGEAAGH